MNADDSIQESLENGELITTPDGLAYKKVFDALRREPDYALPVDFADRIAVKIEQQKAEAKRDRYMLVMGLAGFVLATIIAVLLTGFKPDFGALEFLASNTGLICFAAALVALFNLAENKILSKTRSEFF